MSSKPRKGKKDKFPWKWVVIGLGILVVFIFLCGGSCTATIHATNDWEAVWNSLTEVQRDTVLLWLVLAFIFGHATG